jgi:ribonuclease HI
MEYRGVEFDSGREMFRMGPYKEGTNNVGEFLAIVHALAFLSNQGLTDRVIYSDSAVAIGWVKKRTCGTKLEHTRNNSILFDLIYRAEKWLENNPYKNPIRKWETEFWGEIPADFGRK